MWRWAVSQMAWSYTPRSKTEVTLSRMLCNSQSREERDVDNGHGGNEGPRRVLPRDQRQSGHQASCRVKAYSQTFSLMPATASSRFAQMPR